VRLAFLYPNLNIGGQQTYTIQLMRALTALGHTCMYAYNTDGPLKAMVTEFAEALHFPIYPCGEGDWRVARAMIRRLHAYQTSRYLRRVVLEWCPNAVFTANIDMGLLVGNAIAGHPIRHYKLVGHSLTQVNQHYVPIYEALQPRLRMTGYFGPSSLLSEYARLGVPSQQLHEVPDAVDTDRFMPLPDDRRRAIRERLGILPTDFVLGWVGRLSRGMQFWNTIELCARLRKSGLANCRLLVVGDGPCRQEVLEMLRDEARYGSALCPGMVSFDDVNEYYNAMDLVPLLEENPYGGSIVREAMAAGRCTISVDGAAGAQRAFMSQGNALLVPSAGFMDHAVEASLALASLPGRRAAIGAAARSLAESEMSFSTLANRIDSVLRRSMEIS
jgi:glycosyltransferase involved in cell wall biosynthesis